MKVLLDTHALIWAMTAPERLSVAARETIVDEGNTILVSAASAWEIATKVRLGKLPGAERLEREFLEREFLDLMEHADYTLLATDAAAALVPGGLWRRIVTPSTA